jgi:hypothetical protein
LRNYTLKIKGFWTSEKHSGTYPQRFLANNHEKHSTVFEPRKKLHGYFMSLKNLEGITYIFLYGLLCFFIIVIVKILSTNDEHGVGF